MQKKSAKQVAKPPMKEGVSPVFSDKLSKCENALAKIICAKENWESLKLNEVFGDMTRKNVSLCIGVSFQTVSKCWNDKPKEKVKPKAKVIEIPDTVSATGMDKSILDEEPVRQTSNKIVSYTTENSTKSLKELYFELGEAHGEMETVEAKIELLETEIQERKFSK